eukprot:CAMPEP_0184697780 /NCGR_PEP_ID=MMETSP0313-20130426/4625_1 /TAXON_ID=2792 /ORGANISM="Porphyridium aerugineum, Strain SAG 1380-2" /LENGTH=462 /DNA_ID=CAMNT_0027156617 /DNA_START=883 /DNA_END=2271 /DNA_ORIENTATION=+
MVIKDYIMEQERSKTKRVVVVVPTQSSMDEIQRELEATLAVSPNNAESRNQTDFKIACDKTVGHTSRSNMGNDSHTHESDGDEEAEEGYRTDDEDSGNTLSANMKSHGTSPPPRRDGMAPQPKKFIGQQTSPEIDDPFERLNSRLSQISVSSTMGEHESTSRGSTRRVSHDDPVTPLSVSPLRGMSTSMPTSQFYYTGQGIPFAPPTYASAVARLGHASGPAPVAPPSGTSQPQHQVQAQTIPNSTAVQYGFRHDNRSMTSPTSSIRSLDFGSEMVEYVPVLSGGFMRCPSAPVGSSITAAASGLVPRAKSPDHSAGSTTSPTPTAPQLVRSASGSSTQPKIKKELYKTEMCRSWEEMGSCRYGLKCQYAHGKEELRPVDRHPKYKTKPCRNFCEKGSCPYGRRCNYSHADKTFSSLDTNTLLLMQGFGDTANKRLPIFENLDDPPLDGHARPSSTKFDGRG